MQRYFAKDKINDELILFDSDCHHIKNVMRSKVSDQIEVIYENIVYICSIENLTPLCLTIIDTKKEDNEMNINLIVAVSLVNEQKFDLILQKLTELGVSMVIPIKTERSIVKLDDKKSNKKNARWNLICKEASEQSKRTKILEVTNIMTLKELKNIDCHLKLICSLTEGSKTLASYLTNDITEVMFVIGPEGGFTPNEETFLLNNGFKATNLSKRVMRVETAAIYVASIINYIYKG